MLSIPWDCNELDNYNELDNSDFLVYGGHCF